MSEKKKWCPLVEVYIDKYICHQMKLDYNINMEIGEACKKNWEDCKGFQKLPPHAELRYMGGKYVLTSRN